MRRDAILVCAVFAFMAISCKGGDSNEAPVVKSVKLESVKDLSAIKRTYTGVVNANQSSELAFKMEGLVTKTYVTSGSKVRKGQLLMELDATDYILDRDAKRVALATQKEAFERAKRLLARNAISQQEYETTEATYEGAKSAYEIAVLDVKDTKLYAPFDGFILDKYVNQYNRAGAGKTVLEIVNPKDLEIKFTVPESNAIFFTEDTEMYVEFDTYKGELFKCQLKELVTASPDGAGIPFKLKIVDPNFSLDKYKVAVGFSCNVVARIVNPVMEGVCSVPLSAIVSESTGDGTYVMVYNSDSGCVEKVVVELTPYVVENGMVALTGDIDSNDQIVVAGASLLNDGQRVKVLTK
ncbi:MAG: efflux RND transporter periplasmic adaptor subunit [Marinifilaceae bacterium]|nr:efflux RND transporter periplasmic adaptor subunit [Marinifilaceae bacterium]